MTPTTSPRLYFTTPCKLLTTQSQEELKDYKDVQLYLVETASANPSLLVCALIEQDSQYAVFSADCQKMVSMRPVSAPATMLKIDFETVQVDILFAHVEYRREFSDLIQEWLSNKASTSQVQVPTKVCDLGQIPAIECPGNDDHGDSVGMLEYLLRCARAVDTTRKVEEADFVYGTLEDLYFEETPPTAL